MSEGADNIRLNEQLESLKDMLGKNTLATERVLWIISDPDTGLVRRVGDIGQLTNTTVREQTALTIQVRGLTDSVKQLQQQQDEAKKTQGTHDKAISDLMKCNDDEKEARKPLITIAYGILEKLLWIAALGIIAWLGSIVLAK